MLGYVITVTQLFFLLTPFLVLALFLSLTRSKSLKAQRKLAARSTFAIWAVGVLIYLVGERLFQILGISLDAFRIGAGLVLLISGVETVRSTGLPASKQTSPDGDDDDQGDIAVVPMAIPYTVGPGTIGALLVMSASAAATKSYFWTALRDLSGLSFAVILIGLLLWFSNKLEQVLKPKGISILSKLTGLFLAALASQIICIGIGNLIIRR